MASNMFRRAQANKEDFFKIREGTLTILNVPGRIIPILTYIALEQALEQNFDATKVREAIYSVGRLQSYHATKLMVEQLGFRMKGNELNLLKETIGHSEVIGSGITDILRYDHARKSFIVVSRNNPVTKTAEHLLPGKEGMDYLSRGNIIGVAEYLFGEEAIILSRKDKTTGHVIYTVKTKAAATNKEREQFGMDQSSLDLNGIEKLFSVQNLTR